MLDELFIYDVKVVTFKRRKPTKLRFPWGFSYQLHGFAPSVAARYHYLGRQTRGPHVVILAGGQYLGHHGGKWYEN